MPVVVVNVPSRSHGRPASGAPVGSTAWFTSTVARGVVAVPSKTAYGARLLDCSKDGQVTKTSYAPGVRLVKLHSAALLPLPAAWKR